MNKTFAGIASSIALLTGCAHLEQAPLVYSSKTTLGVEVSTASVEAPGLAIALGFRQIDAAYVPVAVGRSCRPNSGAQCDGNSYELQIVSGRSEAGNNHGADADGTARRQRFEALTSRFADATKAASDAEQRLQQAKASAAAVRQSLADTRARQDSYVVQMSLLPGLEETVATGDPAAAETAEAARKISEIRALRPETGIAELEIASAKAAAAVESAESAHAASVEELNRVAVELRNAQQAIEEVKRYDSYSVFGSFETGTRAGFESAPASQPAGGDAGISLGKIFATGVASQNISDGLSRFYNSRAVTACYGAVASIASTNPALAARTLEQCQASESRGKD